MSLGYDTAMLSEVDHLEQQAARCRKLASEFPSSGIASTLMDMAAEYDARRTEISSRIHPDLGQTDRPDIEGRMSLAIQPS